VNAKFYESDRAVSEYLLFHYGNAKELLPYDFGPERSLNFPVRCVTDLIAKRPLPQNARALDLGCAVGRASFELAKLCAQVVGIDASERFIEVARKLQTDGKLKFEFVEEGQLARQTRAVVPPEIDRNRVRFEVGDAMNLASLVGFDAVLLANLIDRLPNPRLCLERMRDFVNPGGTLVVTSPYTWLEEFTPRENWLGGFVRNGKEVRTLDTLKEILCPHFDFSGWMHLPFLIREHVRKFQWSVAEASLWIRKTTS
jgi:putative 4-mercaptohistidine N1-methyltranferase